MMKPMILIFLFHFIVSIHPQTADDEIVVVKELIPDIVLDIRYAGQQNFTQQELYTTDEAYLSLIAIRGLQLVQDSLRNITSFNGSSYPQGIGLKIFDGYRPRAAQYLMFEIFPNPIYVADPATGSVHNRGGAVDVSLVDKATGIELQMPTDFDYFGPEAAHSYMNLPPAIIANRNLLKTIMTTVGGFSLYDAEWWHYAVPGATSFPLRDFQMK